jgi:fumarate hydratase subunit beta
MASAAEKRIKLPLGRETRRELKAGDILLLEGRLLTARDEAHRKLMENLSRGEKPPVELAGAVIFYAGPTPVPPGRESGSIGPTTSSRMDPFTPQLAKQGVAAFIGKGPRSPGVCAALRENHALYLVAIGGGAALLGSRVRSTRVVAYEDLGPEAIYELEVKDFPVIVACDLQGGDIFSHLEALP